MAETRRWMVRGTRKAPPSLHVKAVPDHGMVFVTECTTDGDEHTMLFTSMADVVRLKESLDRALTYMGEHGPVEWRGDG